jgi:hypothetical protein
MSSKEPNVLMVNLNVSRGKQVIRPCIPGDDSKMIELDPLFAAHENLGIAPGDQTDLAVAPKESSIATWLPTRAAGYRCPVS